MSTVDELNGCNAYHVVNVFWPSGLEPVVVQLKRKDSSLITDTENIESMLIVVFM